MNRYYYDLHVHSCLSPCGDNDNTPNNLAGMAAIKGLQVLALTDHNTCGNCPAFYTACKRQGIIPIAGMELTTAEDIHLVCLFPSLEEAMAFHEAVQSHRIKIPNRPDIFGEQWILDEEDNPLGTEGYLLLNATDLSLEEGTALVRQMNGLAYPAHIDRDSNGIVATLGFFPDQPDFTCVEYREKEKQAQWEQRFPLLKNKPVVVSSDAHYLWDINEAEHYFEVADEPYSGDKVRREIFRLLRGETE
jgi:PHP family Zn ribbon phosphoesterase